MAETDNPPLPRPRAVDYASVANLALTRAGVPDDVLASARGILNRQPIDSAARLRFKLWVNADPALPFLW